MSFPSARRLGPNKVVFDDGQKVLQPHWCLPMDRRGHTPSSALVDVKIRELKYYQTRIQQWNDKRSNSPIPSVSLLAAIADTVWHQILMWLIIFLVNIARVIINYHLIDTSSGPHNLDNNLHSQRVAVSVLDRRCVCTVRSCRKPCWDNPTQAVNIHIYFC